MLTWIQVRSTNFWISAASADEGEVFSEMKFRAVPLNCFQTFGLVGVSAELLQRDPSMVAPATVVPVRRRKSRRL
jgi:hypothetical protein